TNPYQRVPCELRKATNPCDWDPYIFRGISCTPMSVIREKSFFRDPLRKREAKPSHDDQERLAAIATALTAPSKASRPPSPRWERFARFQRRRIARSCQGAWSVRERSARP